MGVGGVASAQDTTTTTVVCAPNPSLSGQLVTCTATVVSGGFTPTGTVTFQIDGGGDIVVALNMAGEASFSTSSLTVGDHTVAAAYTPDTGDFLGSSDSFMQSVEAAPTTTDVTCAPDPSVIGELVTCLAAVTSLAGTPTGTVTFQIDGGGDIVVPLNMAGEASFSTSTLTLGDHVVSASYTPDTAAFLGSADTFTQTVEAAPVPAFPGWWGFVAALALLAAAAAALGPLRRRAGAA